MKQIEVDDDLYLYIASQTQHIGESASDILRRLLCVKQAEAKSQQLAAKVDTPEAPVQPTSTAMNTLAVDADFPLALIQQEKSSTKRFLSLLSHLYHFDAQRFAGACEIKGNKREYFSQSLDALLASGKTTKPQAIANTPYYVITNTNTQRKRYILKHVASGMGLSDERVQELSDII